MAPEVTLQKQLVRAAIITPALIVLAMTIYCELNWTGYWLQPTQPIAFPHRLHAGVRGIDCQYCHRGARDGYYAGVPSVQDCWSCHRGAVEAGSNGDKVMDRPGVQTLVKDYVNQRRDIKWYKYYDLPEHVKFSHKAHINAGKNCNDCHGAIETMDVVQMQQKPTMGWCVSCHRQNNAPVDCTTCHR
ncbi:MAG: cytochrome c3 family protein [Candidatus Eremiobacteraeota bacterium]|nr:cytochrome c3 family protein [Candidatus Eremiobacteraeota bacterium]